MLAASVMQQDWNVNNIYIYIWARRYAEESSKLCWGVGYLQDWVLCSCDFSVTFISVCYSCYAYCFVRVTFSFYVGNLTSWVTSFSLILVLLKNSERKRKLLIVTISTTKMAKLGVRVLFDEMSLMVVVFFPSRLTNILKYLRYNPSYVHCSYEQWSSWRFFFSIFKLFPLAIKYIYNLIR
jgi:hypothetical protein